jgi:hypothetical protein
MNIFDGIEKLITEHGSAAILSQQLSFARDQFSVLERQVGEFQAKVAKLEAQLEIEHANYKETQQQLQRLQEEHSEEIRVHKSIEFRRGKRTGGSWVAFCPVCHTPADTTIFVKCPNAKCKWELILAGKEIPKLISEL